MATKEVKQNLEQYSVIAFAGATIAVAILEQRQRKLSAGYLQNCDLQFLNLTHASPRLLFTLVFSYKKGRASHKTAARNRHWKNREQKGEDNKNSREPIRHQ